jgi:hypothetical protein
MSGLAASAAFKRREDLVFRDVTGELLIVPVRHGVGELQSVYVLNGLGSDIWKLLDGKRSAREIAEELSRQYEVGNAEVQRDVEEFLAALNEAGLVRQE